MKKKTDTIPSWFEIAFRKMMTEVLHKYNLKQGKWRVKFLVRDARKRWRTK